MPMPMSGMGTGPGQGAGGMLAGFALRSPIMGGQEAPEYRPVPGSTGEKNPFYDNLAAGDKAAEAIVRAKFKAVRQSSLEGRELLERGWWQKLLYINGRQWIYYNNRGGWQDKRMARWIPRPVTNICRETVQTIRAMLSGIEVTARARPAGPDPINTITARIVDDIEPVLREEHQLRARFFEADYWAPAVGLVALHPYWDRDNPANREFIQAQACPECQWQAHPLDIEEGVIKGCPTCGMPSEQFVPAVDPQTREPIGESAIVGAGATDVVSVLELLIPTYFQRKHEISELIRLRWRPKTYYDGRPYASQISYRSTPQDRSLQMFRAQAMMTDLTTSPFQGTGATSSRIEGAIEAELWCKPNDEYPEGLWCRAVGGNQGESLIIRDDERGIRPGPLPFRDIKGRPLWPWIWYPFEEQGGKIFALGALESVVQKQDQINRNDSMVELIMQRMANPIWLEPKGAEVQRFTGEPGLVVRYSIVAGTNAKPERLEGMSLQQSFFTLRDQYFSDAERMAGTGDVLKGRNPAGVEAYSALNLLVERSQSRFTSLFKSRGEAYRGWLEIALELERVYGPQTRVKAIVGKNNQYTFETFQKQDLRGAVTIVIEDGTETPKTALGKRAALQQAKEFGFLNTADSDVAYQGLELLGITSMAPALNIHVTSSQIEHHQYEEWVRGGRRGPTPLKVTSSQNHLVHITQFDIWANSDKIRELRLTDMLLDEELTFHRLQHSIGALNPFNLPVPAGMGLPGAPGAGGPGGPAGPGAPGAPAGPEGAGMAEANSLQESGAVDTLPGVAPGGGNMAAPA